MAGTVETPILDETEFLAMLAQCNTKTPTGARNRALLLLMGRVGLRCAEALAVSPKMVKTKEGLRCLCLPKTVTKGKKPRASLPLGEDVLLALSEWQQHRDALGLDPKAPWFCTIQAGRRTGFGGVQDLTPGSPLSDRYVRDLVKRLGVRAGVEPERAHPHTLRHTALTDTYRRSKDLRATQVQAGHSSSTMTERYTYIGTEDLARAMGVGPEEPETAEETKREAALAELQARVEELQRDLAAALGARGERTP